MGGERIRNLVTISLSEGKWEFGTDVELNSEDVARTFLDQVFKDKSQQEVTSLIDSSLDTLWPNAPNADYMAGLKFFSKTVGLQAGLDSVEGLINEVGKQLRERSEPR